MSTSYALIDAVRAQAAAHPDRRYRKPAGDDSCRYTLGTDADTGEATGCIVGCALLNCGVLPAMLAALDSGPGTPINTIRARRQLGDNLLGSLTQAWCAYVQQEQDSGSSWAHAVARADAEFPQARAR